MTTSDGVILYSKQVIEWRLQKAELEKEIAQKRQELAVINRRLEAVAILSEPTPSDKSPPKNDESPSRPDESMTDAVERIVIEAGRPMTKADLKKALRSAGFEWSRLGNYFYTVIARLKEKERITVRSDGRVGPSLLS